MPQSTFTCHVALKPAERRILRTAGRIAGMKLSTWLRHAGMEYSRLKLEERLGTAATSNQANEGEGS